MAGWTPLGDWMHFRHLDGGGADLDGAFTIGYRITDDGSETWTGRFNRFKAKNADAFSGGLEMVRAGMPGLVTSLGIRPANAVFVPALSSGETKAAPHGQMSVLAGTCAGAAGARFEPNALSKQAHKPIHNIFNASDREAELDKAAYTAANLPVNNVFVFDDFITRGSTQARIAQAIKAANPQARVYGVALAKTDRRAWLPNLSNDHVSKTWDDRWLRGEQVYRDGQMKGKA
jgi:hypothetical protein